MGSGKSPSSVPAHIAVTSVRIEKTKLEAFKRIADAERRSVSQQLRWLIDRAIDEHEEREAA
jgi:predicted DNA-binding ribbon-helix-helix protein